MSNSKEQFSLPERGIVFWPVGNGDSTTICVNDEVIIQVDLRHASTADEDGDPHTPIVDRLEDLLPTVSGEPYLTAFVLTHPDQDHCLGFAELLKRVKIGELWFSPRVFREYTADLCDDAKAFRREAKRRVKKTIDSGGQVPSGDRVRIIGYDELLEEDDYRGFPRGCLTIPGEAITEVDEQDCANTFRAFVHAPFKDDTAGDRNETSVALQVTITNRSGSIQVLLLGDLSYPTIRKIFSLSNSDDLVWNLMLAAHHCSKSVMYWQESGEDEEKLKRDILDDMEKASRAPGYIVASSDPIPDSNRPGDNPPHAKAKSRYQEIAPAGFLCTQEHPNTEKPEPIVFELAEAGATLAESKGVRAAAVVPLSRAVADARGKNEPPRGRTGYGCEYD